jgi:hypothetical protein
MVQNQHKRTWVLIAAIAIVAALVLMLVPHGDAGHADLWLAVLPILFIGVIAPLRLLRSPECFDLSRSTDAPALQPSFERPPPFRLA